MFEFSVLNNLKGKSKFRYNYLGCPHVPNVYDFVHNSEQNLIVMDLMGINLAKARRCLETNYSLKIVV